MYIMICQHFRQIITKHSKLNFKQLINCIIDKKEKYHLKSTKMLYHMYTQVNDTCLLSAMCKFDALTLLNFEECLY